MAEKLSSLGAKFTGNEEKTQGKRWESAANLYFSG